MYQNPVPCYRGLLPGEEASQNGFEAAFIKFHKFTASNKKHPQHQTTFSEKCRDLSKNLNLIFVKFFPI